MGGCRRPVGATSPVACDVRIVAATNRDLAARVKSGAFREDLFYRLNVITIELPPLRERREDIPLLIRHFLRQFSDLHGRRVSRFSVAAGRILLQHHYPGNIRELENVVEHAVALCEGDMATEEHLPLHLLGDSHASAPASREVDARAPGATDPSGYCADQPADVPAMRDAQPQPTTGWAPSPPRPPAPPSADPVDLERDLAEYEKAILLRALDQAGGVKKRAAALLGINYRSLRHRLQKYGLSDAADDPVVQ